MAVDGDVLAEALDGPEKSFLSIDLDCLEPAYAPGVGKTLMRGSVGFNLVGGYCYNVEKPQRAAASMLCISANFVSPWHQVLS